jgi:K+-sensing histidine kinase KdpD
MMKRYTIRIQDRDGFERRIPLGNVTVLGRQKQCDVVLSDEMVSRLHLRVECLDGKCWVEDLGSSHGTYQDGARIKRIPWDLGTVLIIADGAYKLMLVQDRDQAPNDTLHSVLSTAQLLMGEFDLEQILQKSLDHLLRLSGQDRGYILMTDGQEGGSLEICAHRNLSPDFKGQAELSMSSVRRVFESGEPIWVSDISTSDAMMNQHSIIDLQIMTILCLPLLAKDKCIGVVYLDSNHIKADPIDRSSFEAIVGLCALAIERARIAEEYRRNSYLAASGSPLDFRETLFSIESSAAQLLARCSTPDAKRHAEEIQALAGRLAQLASEMLGLAGPHRPLEKAPTDLANFLNGRIASWQERLAGRDVEITGSGPELEVSMDKGLIASAIDGLIANSVDAIAASGSKGSIRIAWDADGGGATIKISDSGVGISKKKIAIIFDSFYSSKKETGPGLGLPKAKSIAEAHGGSISVASEIGRGTTMTIHLPGPKAGLEPHDGAAQKGKP